MTHIFSGKVWTSGFAVMLMAASAVAQQAPTPAAPPVAAQVPVVVERYLVGQARPPVTDGAPVVDLTLEQAMLIALEKNLDLQVARLTPQNIDYQLQSARAAFLPRYSTTYSYRSTSSPSNNTTQGVATLIGNTQNFNGTYAQLLPFHGSSFTTSFTNSRAVTNDRSARTNPNFNSQLAFTYTQPLLAGFKMDNTRNTLRTLGISRQVADLQLLSTIENTKASVRTAYWSLRQAIEQIDIGRLALDLANRLFQDNNIKVEIGTLAPIETTQSEAQVANAEQALLQAQITWRTAELTLKRLLASGPDDPIYAQTVNPTEQALLSVQAVDIPGAIKLALATRADISVARKNIESSLLSLEVTKDLTKPQLDLSAGYNSTGQGGNILANGVVVTPGGYTDAIRALSSFNTAGWNTALNFTLPFGRDITVNRVSLARAQLSLDQAYAQIKAQELTITSDVTIAGLNVDNTYKQFQAAQKAREVAERNADAEQTRFDVGMSTNYNVVLAQNNLTSQRLNELRALIGYRNALAEFERIQKVGR